MSVSRRERRLQRTDAARAFENEKERKLSFFLLLLFDSGSSFRDKETLDLFNRDFFNDRVLPGMMLLFFDTLFI